MRTTEEIVERMRAIKEDDFFGFRRGDLVAYLPYEAAKEFLVSGMAGTKEEWETMLAGRPKPLDAALGYLPFAWDKANNCRGLSAMRSLEHLREWLWLSGHEIADKVNKWADEYTHYGKPVLREICEAFGVDWRALDDGRWLQKEGGESVEADDVPRLS